MPRLHERFPALAETLPHLALSERPTPARELGGLGIHRTHTKARTVAMLPWLLARNARGGRPPYLLPAGGSSPVGVLGYVEAALEIAAQVGDGSLPEPAHVVVPVGTGGTAAGPPSGQDRGNGRDR